MQQMGERGDWMLLKIEEKINELGDRCKEFFRMCYSEIGGRCGRVVKRI